MYGVPARVGMRVTVHGKHGKLVRGLPGQLHYIHVKFDGKKHSVPAHPTDRVEYHLS
jgi:hypothetical protein